jgi:hypothetical protein
MNPNGDIYAIGVHLYGADWSTVPSEKIRLSDAEYWVTAHGIRLTYIEWPSGGREGIQWILEP